MSIGIETTVSHPSAGANFYASDDQEVWRNAANCLGVNTELFFPTEDPALARQAKEVCRNCVVREECLDYALASNEMGGVWGGTDEDERAVLPKPV